MQTLRLVLLSAGAILLALLISGHLNALHPAFDSVGHFRLHLAAAGILTGLILLATRSLLGGAALATVSALSFLTTIWPALGAGKAQAAGEPTAIYRLLQANLRFDNQTPEEFIRMLGETKPDIATVEEIPDMWAKRLMTVSAIYPHQLICPGRDRIGGVAIISRRPFTLNGLTHCDSDGALAVQAIDIGGRTVTVSAMHLEWPWPKMQPQQLGWLKPVFQNIKEAGHPVLIGGDMNATPWSAAVGRIATETGTRALPQARGTWIFKWFPKSLTPWFGLPIDNIMASSEVTVHSAATQRPIGSDHLPILLEFSLDSAGGAKPEPVDS